MVVYLKKQKSLIREENQGLCCILVAGAGFEPTTFGL